MRVVGVEFLLGSREGVGGVRREGTLRREPETDEVRTKSTEKDFTKPDKDVLETETIGEQMFRGGTE